MDAIENLFVYGTLRPPEGDSAPIDSFNFPKVLPYLKNSFPARLPGAVLYDLSAFPAMRPGTGTVTGAVLQIDPRAFEVLDPLEGHPNIYFRARVVLETATGPLEAWVYWASESLAAQGTLIANGDWLRRDET